MGRKEFRITAGVFIAIFFVLIILSILGFGAPRYHNKKYNNSNTFFVSGSYSYAPSARVGSVGGPGVQGGGLHAGK